MSLPRRLPAACLALLLGLGPSPVLGAAPRGAALRPMPATAGLEEDLSGLENGRVVVKTLVETQGLNDLVADDVSDGAETRERVLKAALLELRLVDSAVDPHASLVVNAWSGPMRLKGINLVNWDEDGHPEEAPLPNTTFVSGSLHDLKKNRALHGGLPRVVLLDHPNQNMGESTKGHLVSALLKEAWDLVADGGWLLLIEPRPPGTRESQRGLDYFFSRFLTELNHTRPDQALVIRSAEDKVDSPHSAMRDAVVLALHKPSPSMAGSPPASVPQKRESASSLDSLEALLQQGLYEQAEGLAKVLLSNASFSTMERWKIQVLGAEASIRLGDTQSLSSLKEIQRVIEAQENRLTVQSKRSLRLLRELYASAALLQARALVVSGTRAWRNANEKEKGRHFDEAADLREAAKDSFNEAREAIKRATDKDNGGISTNLRATELLTLMPPYESYPDRLTNQRLARRSINQVMDRLEKMGDSAAKDLLKAKALYYRFVSARRSEKLIRGSAQKYRQAGDLKLKEAGQAFAQYSEAVRRGEAQSSEAAAHHKRSQELTQEADSSIQKARKLEDEIRELEQVADKSSSECLKVLKKVMEDPKENLVEACEIGVRLHLASSTYERGRNNKEGEEAAEREKEKAREAARPVLPPFNTANSTPAQRWILARIFHAIKEYPLGHNEVSAFLDVNPSSKAAYSLYQELADDLQEEFAAGEAPPASGLEERVDEALAVLAEAVTAEPGRVLVLEKTLVDRRAGLEELVKRLPTGLAEKVVVFDPGATTLTDLALNLMARPEVEQIGYAGLEENGSDLAKILPRSITVTLLGSTPTLAALLGGFVPQAVVNQVDAAGLEEDLARLHAA